MIGNIKLTLEESEQFVNILFNKNNPLNEKPVNECINKNNIKE